MIHRDVYRDHTGEPLIASLGEAVLKEDAPFIQLAADELNLGGSDGVKYVVELADYPDFAPNGRRLPEGLILLRLNGPWALDTKRDLTELDERAITIKNDLGDIPDDFDKYYLD
jgi:hypothetical protein